MDKQVWLPTDIRKINYLSRNLWNMKDINEENFKTPPKRYKRRTEQTERLITVLNMKTKHHIDANFL